MRACTVCGEWYPCRIDRLDICEPCYDAGFPGARPPLDVHAPRAREVMEAYASPEPPDHAAAGAGPGPHARVLATAAGRGALAMTLQHLIDVLSTMSQDATLTDLAITRIVLLAYELGLEQGRKEAHALDGG